jgi:multiple sugar transport system substrate-binding protein
MKKTLVSILLLLAMMLNVLALASCSGGGGTTTDIFLEPPKVEIPEAGYDPEAKVTVTFYHTMGENLTTVLDKYIEKFNEIYPNITIDHDQVGGYDDVRETISTELAVGGGPNIAYCYPDHVALYRRANKVIALDDLIASQASDGKGGIIGMTDAEKENFIDGYWDEGFQFDDGTKMYTLPFSKSTEVLYYNKTFFQANNLKVPTTWEELAEVCRQIKKIDPNNAPLGYDSESNWFITLAEQYGSNYTSVDKDDHFLFNNKVNRDFIKMLRGWYDEGLFTTQELYGSYTSGLFVAQDDTKSYMSIGSSAGATHQRPAADADGNYPFEVGIATVPQVDASNPKVISQGPSLCIFDKANKQEVLASWLFVKFLTTNVEFQAEFSMASGYVPVIKSVGENEVYKSFIAQADGGNHISALSAKVCLEQADAYYTSPAFNGSSTARDQVGALLTKCLTMFGDDVDAQIDKAFEEAVKKCIYS